MLLEGWEQTAPFWVPVSSGTSCDSEGSDCHRNHHLSKLLDKIIASRNRTSNGCLERAELRVALCLNLNEKLVTGCDWLKGKGEAWGEDARVKASSKLLKAQRTGKPDRGRGVGWGRGICISHHALRSLLIKIIDCAPTRCQEVCRQLVVKIMNEIAVILSLRARKRTKKPPGAQVTYPSFSPRG